MRTAVCDCVVEFSQKSLAVEDDLGIEYIEPETFADELGRDLYMAFCREMATWKALPDYGQSSATCYLGDIEEVGDDMDFFHKEYRAVFTIKIVYPDGVDIESTVLSILDDFGMKPADQ